MGDETITPTGFGLTSSLGSVSVSTEINTGWGRQPWNENAWGIAGDVLLEGVSATASVGSLVVGDILGLTGQSATASVGSPTIIGDITASLTGQSATASVGSIDIAGQIVGLTGQSATCKCGIYISGRCNWSHRCFCNNITWNSYPQIVIQLLM